MVTPFTTLLFALLATPVPLQDETPRPTGSQEPEAPEPVQEEPQGPLRPEQMFPDDSLQQELVELFQRVERNMMARDRKLADAGAGEAPVGAPEDTGIDDLLREAEALSRQQVQDIERILEIAKQLESQNPSSSSSGSSSQERQPSGDSPLDQERDRGPTEKEETPTTPEGEEPHENQGQEQEKDGDQPRGNQEDRDPGENRPGKPRDDERGPRNEGRTGDATWGQLPPRVRERFRNQGTENVPIQYRDWIDSYYRRLNKKRP